MDISQVTNILGFIGEKLALATQFIIKKFAELGININSLGSKIINILIILALIWVVIKFVSSLNNVIKFLIILLLVVLVLSTFFSFAI